MYFDILKGIFAISGIVGGFFLLGFGILYSLDYIWQMIIKYKSKRGE